MSKRVFIVLVGALLLGAPVGSEESGNESLLGSDGKLTALDWTPQSKTEVKPVDVPVTLDASGVYGALLFLLGLGGAAAALVWYVRNRTHANPKATARLAVVERLSLGARRELLLVRAGERLLVLASLQQDLKLLAALPGPELSDAMESDLTQLFQLQGLESGPAVERTERSERREAQACATPSLTIDWPTGPTRG